MTRCLSLGCFFLVFGAVASASEAHPLLKSTHAEGMAKAMAVESLDELPSYRLDLSVSDQSGHFEGRGRLQWTNRTGRAQSVLPFLLHSNGANEREMRLYGGMRLESMTTRTGLSGVLKQIRTDLLHYELEGALQPGDSIELEFEWEGWLRNLGDDDNDLFTQAMASFGAMGTPVGGADYGLLAAGDGLVTMASAYPMLAPFRAGVAQTDAPAKVGDLAWNQVCAFSVRVVTPAGLEVVTNLEDGNRVDLGSGAQMLEAEGWGVRDFVLVASREFEKNEAVVDGVRVRSWYLKEDREAGEKSFRETPQILRFFSQQYGEYPFTELDVVEATLVGGAGGVEFSGMVLMAGFLYRDPATSTHPIGSLLNALSALGAGGQDVDLASSMDEQRLFVLAHELAHQWSPSLVGTNALLSPVVDEPLAQYLAGRAMQEMMGERDGAESRDQNVLLNYAIYRLLGGEDKAADRPTEDYSGALEYAALVYGKAPYFYVDMEKRLGKRRLDRALRGAFSDLAWEIAYGPSWLAALEANGATGAVSHGDRWFSQARGDLDLELDAEGHRAMELVLGEEAGRMTTEMLSSLGMTPAELFALLGALGR